MRAAAVFFLAVAVSGCGPRPADYFRAHPEEARRVIARCEQRGLHDRECDAAKAAEADRKASAREAIFRKGFE